MSPARKNGKSCCWRMTTRGARVIVKGLEAVCEVETSTDGADAAPEGRRSHSPM